MTKPTGPTNYQTKLLIRKLKKKYQANKRRIWKRLIEELEKPRRIKRGINLYQIEKFGREGETVVVPGKVLSLGELNKQLEIAAFDFSEKAKEKINEKGKALSIEELMEKNPKLIKIIG